MSISTPLTSDLLRHRHRAPDRNRGDAREQVFQIAGPRAFQLCLRHILRRRPVRRAGLFIGLFHDDRIKADFLRR
ncbi:MAG: hypothetical protein U5N10_16395 [Gemmobacter sp.]|nr:hypothetical protein [Gemmobacter sp.]